MGGEELRIANSLLGKVGKVLMIFSIGSGYELEVKEVNLNNRFNTLKPHQKKGHSSLKPTGLACPQQYSIRLLTALGFETGLS